MYRNILLTILVVFAAIAAVKLAPTRQKPAPPLAPGPDDLLLATPVAEFSAHGVSVPKAIELLSRKSGVPINVEWASFKEFHDAPADIDLRNVRLDDAIAAIFRENRVNPIRAEPAVNVDPSGKLLMVTATYPTPASWMILKVYDVRDLLTDEHWGPAAATPGVDIAKDRVEKLAALVSINAESRNWEFRGVRLSHYPTSGMEWISGSSGRLIVMEPRFKHRRIADILAILRGRAGLPRR